MTLRTAMLTAALLATALPGISARAADVVTDWAGVTAPPPPTVVIATADVKTTALLLLDFNMPPCDPEANPRCSATIPAVTALLSRARATGMLVIHTLGASTSVDSINPALKAFPNEPVIPGRPDKFLNTDLDEVLRQHGIETVITTGTFTNGAVLYTASEAAFRGYTVLVPIDGVSGLTPYADQMTLWQLLNGPRLGGDTVKLTKTDAIRFF